MSQKTCLQFEPQFHAHLETGCKNKYGKTGLTAFGGKARFLFGKGLPMEFMRTAAGDRWRNQLHGPDGKLSPRVENPDVERQFWHDRIKTGIPLDAYAQPVFAALMNQVEFRPISSVLEIGPGWGNYTFPLSKKFSRVTAVDMSPDNLEYLLTHTQAEGHSICPICSPWEQADPELHDLVFGYNCLYRLQYPEVFIQKMNEAARVLCVLGMNCPPELPWLPVLEKSGFSVHYTRQGCSELLQIMEEMGIPARLVDIPNRRQYRYANEEALLQRAQGFLLESCPCEALLPVLLPFHKKEPDGSLICDYQFHSQLLVWEPTDL